MVRTTWWRHLPNAISAARLAATPLLLYFVATGARGPFTWLLLACLLSDILDGLIARAFNLRSELGAALDSRADMLVFALSVLGLVVFQGPFMRANGLLLAAPLALYAVEAACALWRYGRITSFHTVLVRITAYVQGTLIMWLFLWGEPRWLLYTTVALSVAAYAEELVLIALLPDWETDVRGVYWVLSRRRAEEAQ